MLKLVNVCKTFYTDGKKFDAVKNVSLEIQKGEIFGIIGLSGAGKSTLIRCMNRLETPTSGDILIDGESVLTMKGKQLRDRRKKVTMIFQQFNLLMQSTVAKNVRYPLELAHVPKAKADARVKELLEIVGLSDKADSYPAQLSGGQKQRVAIARALASNPEVLLCDEATSAPTSVLESKLPASAVARASSEDFTTAFAAASASPARLSARSSASSAF